MSISQSAASISIISRLPSRCYRTIESNKECTNHSAALSVEAPPRFLHVVSSDSALSLELSPLSNLRQVGSAGAIQVGGRGQTARIWALRIKFAPNKAFTFDIRYDLEDDTEVSTVRSYDCNMYQAMPLLQMIHTMCHWAG